MKRKVPFLPKMITCGVFLAMPCAVRGQVPSVFDIPPGDPPLPEYIDGSFIEIYKDFDPWYGEKRVELALADLGFAPGEDYGVKPTSDLLNPIPSDTQVIIIPSNSWGPYSPDTWDNVNHPDAQANLEAFVRSGGVLVMHVADLYYIDTFQPPGMDKPDTPLPNGNSYDLLAAAPHSMVLGPDSIAPTADDLTQANIQANLAWKDGGGCCVVMGYLPTLPAGATTIIASDGNPVLAEYPLGCGLVIVTTMPLEFGNGDADGSGFTYGSPRRILRNELFHATTAVNTAGLEVHAAKHTVGSGSSPSSTKEPLVGLEVCAYDKSQGSCARQQDEQGNGISWQEYPAIVANCDPADCTCTDADGIAFISLLEGDYIVIGGSGLAGAGCDGTQDAILLGVSASNLVCGELQSKHLKLLEFANGNKKAGKTTRLTGSELLIIEPEYILWDDTEQLYPFVFEAVGDWGVTTTVVPPEGFVSDYDALSADVDNEVQVVQFTITEVGSDLVPTETTFDVTHKGRRMTVRSEVGIMLTPEYARSRGFNVAELRRKGLIKESRRVVE